MVVVLCIHVSISDIEGGVLIGKEKALDVNLWKKLFKSSNEVKSIEQLRHI